MRRRTAGAALVAVLIVAGCGSSKNDSGSATATTAAAAGATTAVSSGGGGGSGGICQEGAKGKAGFLNQFCDGPAVAKITVDGKTREVKGGSCETSGKLFAFNAGVVVDSSKWQGAKPDYVGMVNEDTSATAGSMVWSFGGAGDVATSAKVVVDGKKATGEGKGMVSSSPVIIEITC